MSRGHVLHRREACSLESARRDFEARRREEGHEESKALALGPKQEPVIEFDSGEYASQPVGAVICPLFRDCFNPPHTEIHEVTIESPPSSK